VEVERDKNQEEEERRKHPNIKGGGHEIDTLVLHSIFRPV